MTGEASLVGRVVTASCRTPWAVLLLCLALAAAAPVSLAWELAVTLLFRPALLAAPREEKGRRNGRLDAKRGAEDNGGLRTTPE